MKLSKIRLFIPAAIIILVAIGFASHAGVGTLSALGWRDIALLCPLGSLSTMLAAKAAIPRALVSLAIAAVLILLVGKAFCSWVCPVPLVSKLRGLFGGKNNPEKTGVQACVQEDEASTPELSRDEAESLRRSMSACSKDACGSNRGEGCASCSENRAALKSRHYVLGGSLLSAAVFGFPVFCLICPIGLTFASILLIMRLFTDGDMTWAVVAVPALLLAEVVFFRKWCHTFCPLGAFMSIIAKANRSFQPSIDEDVCLEKTHDAHCGKCAEACPEGIDLRAAVQGAPISECTRCRSCVDACPSNAISMPFLPKGGKRSAKREPSANPASGADAETSENIPAK